MISTAFKLKCPSYYDLYNTCCAHGWLNLSPFAWDEDTRTLSSAMLENDISFDVSVHQKGSFISGSLNSQKKLMPSALNQAKEMIRRSLGLDIDIIPLLKRAEKNGPEYVALIKKGAGRLLRCPTLWEDAAKTLFTTNCTWSLTRKMCESVCADTFAKPSPSGVYPFPRPENLSRYSADELKAMLPVGYRAGYLKELADRFSIDMNLENIESNGYKYKEADRIVRQSKGFADYACAHLLVLAGYYNEIPVDTTVVAFMKRNFPRVRKYKSFIDRRYRKWGAYKWWGYKFDTILAKQNGLGD